MDFNQARKKILLNKSLMAFGLLISTIGALWVMLVQNSYTKVLSKTIEQLVIITMWVNLLIGIYLVYKAFIFFKVVAQKSKELKDKKVKTNII